MLLTTSQFWIFAASASAGYLVGMACAALFRSANWIVD